MVTVCDIFILIEGFARKQYNCRRHQHWNCCCEGKIKSFNIEGVFSCGGFVHYFCVNCECFCEFRMLQLTVWNYWLLIISWLSHQWMSTSWSTQLSNTASNDSGKTQSLVGNILNWYTTNIPRQSTVIESAWIISLHVNTGVCLTIDHLCFVW